MNGRETIAVIGGSIGGILAGVLLQRAGYAANVYERVGTALSSRGAGIVTHPELIAIMEEVGAGDVARLGVETTRRRLLAGDGSVSIDFPRHQIQASWNGIYDALRRQLAEGTYHPDHDLEALEPEPDQVVARFSNGARIVADILVGADGIGSRVRQQTFPSIAPEYAGYVGWRGIVDISALSPASRSILGDAFTMALPGDEQFVGYPVPAASADEPSAGERYNFVWYRPASAETQLADLLTDSTGKTHAGNIPPPLIRPDVTDRLREFADANLPPALAEAVRATPQPFLQPIYDLESTQLRSGRVVLIGDAAFVARPHVGAGVTKAAGDAQCLVAALLAAPTVDLALKAYEDQRLREGRLILKQARRLGENIGHPGRGCPPATLLDETAWLDFLRDTHSMEHET